MPRCNWIRNLLPLSLLFATIAEALPETFSATYDFIAEGITLGETHYQLENVDNTIYRFTTHTQPTGLAALLINKVIDEESLWRWSNNSIRPLQYRYQQQGKKEKQRSRDFDWSTREVNLTDNGRRSTLSNLPDRTVDEALFLLALMEDLRKEERELRYPLAKPGHWDHYQFQRGATQQIQVPAGNFKAVQITRQQEGPRSFLLWATPKLQYLPVLIEYREEDGKLFQLKLRRSSLQ